MFPFYTLWKHQKTFSFLVFSGGIKWEHWPEMNESFLFNSSIFYDIHSIIFDINNTKIRKQPEVISKMAIPNYFYCVTTY